MKLKYFPLVLLSIFFFAQSALPQNAHAQTLIAQNMQNGIGTVISLQAGVFALRDGQEVPLELKSSIQEKDTIITNSTGKVQIILNDDTTLALAPNSRLLMEEFSMDTVNPVIRTNLTQGLVRSITGIIVEQNPDGFSMTTPNASIAIRGTIFAVEYENDNTSTYVFNTKKQVLVNGLEIPSGSQYSTLSGDIIPITQDTFREINELTNIATTVQTGQVSQTNTSDNANTDDNDDIDDNEDTDDDFDDNDFAENDFDDDFDDDDFDDDFDNDDFDDDDFKEGFTAVVSGTLHQSSGSIGSFSFEANLSTGIVSDADMNTTASEDNGMQYTFEDGAGTVEGGAVDIDFVNGDWENTNDNSPSFGEEGDNATGSLTGNLTESTKPNKDVDFDGAYTAENGNISESSTGTAQGNGNFD